MASSSRPVGSSRSLFTIGGVSFKPLGILIHKSLVTPSQPTKPDNESLPLSNLDLVVTPAYVQKYHHFFDSAVISERSFKSVVTVTSLKKSLAEVLVDFFPLSGKLELRDEGLEMKTCSATMRVLEALYSLRSSGPPPSIRKSK